MRQSYIDIASALEHIEVEENGYNSVLGYFKMVRDTRGPNGARIIFIGNGGSAAIASHMAADYMKNGHLPTLLFNDPASLTCISNDLGYDQVFSMPLKHLARFGDVLVAISSSGESKNIINAAKMAADMHLNVVTLTGFLPTNRLRKMGGVNFYVPSQKYGTVEIAHLAVLHSLLDEVMHVG